ncbi:MAG TPA: chemotaxis protein CheB [Acidobacteriaceae bacterium]|jgi:two-component system chemotaxis response regulator CheB
MRTRDIIVIGASAGGVRALQELVSRLPADLPAAVFVTLHLPTIRRSMLPEILSASGTLPAQLAEDGLSITPGRIYIAPPNRHLLLSPQVIRLGDGPRENLQRPCINVMFRSAAETFGPRVIGVVLTGLLDDGAAGLWAIQRSGGLAIVQDPNQAAYPSMPENAIRGFAVNHIVRLSEMGDLLSKLTRTPILHDESNSPGESEIEERRQACPECGGVMLGFKIGEFEEFRCHTGHRLGLQSMISSKTEWVERTTWMALSQTEELLSLLTDRVAHVDDREREALEDEILQRQTLAQSLRELLIDVVKVTPASETARAFKPAGGVEIAQKGRPLDDD